MDRTPLDRFTASQQLLVAKAQERLAVTASLYSGKSTEELQAILAHQYGKLVTEYGDAVAAAAARMYEELRPRELGVFNAEVAAQYSDVEFAARLRQAAKGKTQASLAMGLQKDIMDMGRETIAHNMRRDKSRVKWARVPKGKTCAWCTMLASRGWVYASEVSAGGRGHEYHASCDCMIVPSWEHGTPKLKGYDPARLNEQYQTARKAAKSGDPREIAAKMRELFPDECTDGHIPDREKKKPGPKPKALAAPSGGWPSGRGGKDEARWAKRQARLKSDTSGEFLAVHEIEFLEKFEALGHKVQWIPSRREEGVPTNDFMWVSQKELVCELKTTGAKYSTIKSRIQKAVINARENKKKSVVKDVFIIDIGGQKLRDPLRKQLVSYNKKVKKGTIRKLFVLSNRGKDFEEIKLI